ncbi:hypothetical protein [Alicyclobacillus sp.]|uniref:hypothetical protein n=1 Tax=Alicyclobacillus sp. TaxID=61169 RepID=UPI0025BD3570|nr:hypothetical protein [Alicyclobacillus sp.]MCL6515346.1 hypothetical protein [Alicyclobacillus sp.]
MRWQDPRYAFPKAKQYAFLYENAHLILFCWDRDDARFLFLIKEQREDGLILDYPGETFTQRVLDAVQPIFFVQVQEEGREARPYVLGSYFMVGKRAFGAYYPQDDAGDTDVVLFRIDGEVPDLHLEVPEPEEYQEAVRAFTEQHRDFVEVLGANR